MIRKSLIAVVITMSFSILSTTAYAVPPPWQLDKLDAGTYKHLDAHFGSSVAISYNGEFVVVGVPNEDVNGNESVGAVYVYEKQTGLDWTLRIRLVASDGDEFDQFGASVAVTSDAQNIVIGATQDQKNGLDSGKVYVFERSGLLWLEQAVLYGYDAVPNSRFGCSVAISNGHIVVGAEREGSEDAQDVKYQRGAVYSFLEDESNWILAEKIVAFDWERNDSFGAALDLVKHSTTQPLLVVGAREGDCGGVDDTGAVYTYFWSDTYNVWFYNQKLCDPNPTPKAWFGVDVAVSELDYAQNWILVGASRDDDQGTDSGSVHVFDGSEYHYSHRGIYYASDARAGDQFGESVAIDSEMEHFLVGASKTDKLGVGLNVGTVYMFEQLEGLAIWQESYKINADDKAGGDRYGWDVALTGDAKYGVIGAPNDNIGLIGDAGSAYVIFAIP